MPRKATLDDTDWPLGSLHLCNHPAEVLLLFLSHLLEEEAAAPRERATRDTVRSQGQEGGL